MTYKPERLRRWINQINYEGTDFSEYYVASWRFFRCSPVERSNHAYIREHLLDSGCSENGVITPAFTDQIMRHRYYVLVHEREDKALRMADMFAKRIVLKGSLDPENERKLDVNAMHNAWSSYGIENRIGICREAGISIFVARRPKLPMEYTSFLYPIMSEMTYGE